MGYPIKHQLLEIVETLPDEDLDSFVREIQYVIQRIKETRGVRYTYGDASRRVTRVIDEWGDDFTTEITAMH